MERFWKKVKKTENCWNWIAGVRSKKTGYGCFKVNKKVVDAHRYSWILKNGEIPEGMLICHSCDNRKCVNPNHLFLGSYKENFEDARNKGKMQHLGRNKKYFTKEEKLKAYRHKYLEYWHRRGKYLRKIREKNCQVA